MFWRQTPKVIRLALDAYQEHLDQQHKENAWMAWHIEAFARTKTLPELSRLMGIAPKAQSDEELWNAVQRWVTIHNANYERTQKLGAD